MIVAGVAMLLADLPSFGSGRAFALGQNMNY
jgi:hypothetical protein